MLLPLVLLVVALGCKTEPDSVPAGDTAPEIIAVDCTTSCADTSTDEGKAVCYSCQCKSAMDGWLPSQDELQCAEGEEIVVYSSNSDGSLTPVYEDVTTCANPTLLYGTCSPGGRLGQLTHGTVTAKFICRRNHYVADAASDESLPYDDVGVILYNARNGASCWYDDYDGTGIAGRNMPDLDLTKDDPDNRAAFLGYYYFTEGKSCTGCHDNDPFNYTPYLASVGWVPGAYTFGSFVRVTTSGAFEGNDTSHLTSPEAAACTSCHRITSAATCTTWAPDSYGAAKGAGYEHRVTSAAADPNSALWWLGTWMPYLYQGQAQEKDHDAWEAEYGRARDAVQACCANPGVDGTGADGTACTWEATPEAP